MQLKLESGNGKNLLNQQLLAVLRMLAMGVGVMVVVVVGMFRVLRGNCHREIPGFPTKEEVITETLLSLTCSLLRVMAVTEQSNN